MKIDSLRGWVYIFTNPAILGLVKVGFATKDPHARASELDSEALPYPHSVAFELLVHGPRRVEAEAHQRLIAWHENREWFRCTVEHAASALREVAMGRTVDLGSPLSAPESDTSSNGATHFASPEDKQAFVNQVLGIVRARARDRGEK